MANQNQNKKAHSTPTTICASFIKTVWLHDWWLTQVEMDSKGRRLGVEGLASRERQAISVFGSAAICKRRDTTTLETVDGITIRISGCINRSRTHQNGFPFDVCNRFHFGFPYYWEEYAARSFAEESTNRTVPSRISSLDGCDMSSDSCTNRSLPISFDDLPATRVRDLLMFSPGDSEVCELTRSIFNNTKYGGNAFKHPGPSVHSNEESNSRVMTRVSLPVETPRDQKKNKKHKDDCGMSDATWMRTEESQKNHRQSKMGVGVHGLSKGVATRSMTRSKNLRNKQQENLSSNISIKRGLSEPFAASEAPGNLCRGTMTKDNASNVSHAASLSEEKLEVRKTPEKSAVRRSSRLNKNR